MVNTTSLESSHILEYEYQFQRPDQKERINYRQTNRLSRKNKIAVLL